MDHTFISPGPEASKKSRYASLGSVLLAAIALTFVVAGAAQAQSYVNITVGGAFAPGVYGQVSLGNNPPPPVLNVQPVIVGQHVYGAPVMYLHVAPDEYRDWGRYCSRYGACGHPVHFVRVEDNNRWWVQRNEYLRGQSNYRQPEERRGERQSESRREHRNDRRDYRNDEHGPVERDKDRR